MNILVALNEEEAKLHQQLKAIQGAIQALNGNTSHFSGSVGTGVRRKRTMSAAARAAISRATKARWARFRAEKAKKSKAA
jgi:uncharacterized protein YoxC